MKNITFGVEGMSCQGCVSKINNGVKEIEGIGELSVELQDKTVKVEMAENLSPLVVKKKLEGLGFQVTKMTK